jgi:YD repeat-containing protein
MGGTNKGGSVYKYLGRGTIVEENNAGAKLTYLNTSGNVTGLDRFGRVVDQVWKDSADEVLDEYTYDRAGNRVSKANALNHDLDETYEYDALDRLTEWSLDSLGNDLAAGTYNAANEETPTQGSSGYDAAGNMTTLQSGNTAVYDAWNRLVGVTSGNGESLTTVERYEYDGTGRRIQIFSDFNGGTPDEVQDDYHSNQQVIESDVTMDGTRDGGYQTIWAPRYIDAPILRDTLNTAGTRIVTAERVFYLADANYNITGLAKYDSEAGCPFREPQVDGEASGAAEETGISGGSTRRRRPPSRRRGGTAPRRRRACGGASRARSSGSVAE